jgi:cytochrome c551/c552
MTNRIDILIAALEHRNAEVLHHQINIDNYTLALVEIADRYADCPHMAEFAERLRHLLETSIIEQRKEVIMRDVIAKQVEAG